MSLACKSGVERSLAGDIDWRDDHGRASVIDGKHLLGDVGDLGEHVLCIGCTLVFVREAVFWASANVESFDLRTEVVRQRLTVLRGGVLDVLAKHPVLEGELDGVLLGRVEP